MRDEAPRTWIKLCKNDGRTSARLAVNGKHQPPDSYTDTYAGTSDSTNRAFLLSTALADAAHRDCLSDLIIGDFDFPGAFLHNHLPRSLTGGRQIVVRLPHDLPDPTQAGKYAVVQRCVYGLKQSNNVFDQDLTNLLTKGGFLPTASDPKTYVKRSPTNPANKLTLNLHVDDGWYISNCPLLLADLKTLLTGRYGPIEYHDESTGVCGVELTRHKDHSCTLSLGKYIRKLLTKAGMELVPPALCPSTDIFREDPAIPPTPLLPADTEQFQRINGCLVFLLPIRHDIKKEVTFLCSKNSKPTTLDVHKQTHVLRYLKSCPDLGPTFSANPADFPNGVSIIGASDSAHAVQSNGRSQSAHTISVGSTNNAPFATHSCAENNDVPLSPCEAEYISLTRAAREVMYFRQFAADLGYDQSTTPSLILQDSKSAINLAKAPQIPRKSRHIHIRHHYIRLLHHNGSVCLNHQGTHDILPDGLTKSLAPSQFLSFRSNLFNIA